MDIQRNQPSRAKAALVRMNASLFGPDPVADRLPGLFASLPRSKSRRTWSTTFAYLSYVARLLPALARESGDTPNARPGYPSIHHSQKSRLLHLSRSGSSRQLRSQVYTGSVGPENFCYFVAHPAKNGENLFFASRGFGRIVKAPVVPFHQPRKYRTRLVGVSTDRDYGVYLS